MIKTRKYKSALDNYNVPSNRLIGVGFVSTDFILVILILLLFLKEKPTRDVKTIKLQFDMNIN